MSLWRPRTDVSVKSLNIKWNIMENTGAFCSPEQKSRLLIFTTGRGIRGLEALCGIQWQEVNRNRSCKLPWETE